MTTQSRAALAWLVQAEQNYGTLFIRAHVVAPTPEGELLTLEWDRPGVGRQYADFQVRCYLGHPDYVTDGDPGDLWGFVHEFAPYRVDSAERARSMAGVFTRVQRGLDKAERESGYLAEGDFVGYLLRIGAALNVRTYWVRNHRRQREMTGDRFRATAVSSLQWWLTETRTIARDHPADLDQR
jgi:hypothetical protein